MGVSEGKAWMRYSPVQQWKFRSHADHLAFLCATFPQPYPRERLLHQSEGLSLTLQLDLGPPNFCYFRASLRCGKQIQFSFYFQGTHLKLFILNWPGIGSQTHTQWQALAWWRWPGLACLYFHFPPRFLSIDQWEIASDSPRQTN